MFYKSGSGSGSGKGHQGGSGSGSGVGISVDPDPTKCSGSGWIRSGSGSETLIKSPLFLCDNIIPIVLISMGTGEGHSDEGMEGDNMLGVQFSSGTPLNMPLCIQFL